MDKFVIVNTNDPVEQEKELVEYTDKLMFVLLIKNFYTRALSRNLYDELLLLFNQDGKKRQNIMFGDKINYNLHRNSSDDSVDGYQVEVYPWFPTLVKIKEEIESFLSVDDNKITFNCCLINYYPNGKVGVPYHRDKEMGYNSIVGLSLGQTRTLSMRTWLYDAVNKKYDIKLTSGSLYVIRQPTNEFWQHSILTDKTDKGRISLTFRKYIENEITW